MLRAEPHCIYCRVHHRITFRLLQPCCRFPRSCDTLKRAIDFVNNQGPHDKLGEQTKELDSISTASTIVSLGSTYERVCWNGQLAIMWICVMTVIDMKLYFLASIFFRFLTELVCADVFSYIVYWRLSLTNDVSTFFFGPLHTKSTFTCKMPLRLGESQPGDLQNQLSAALAYIKQLESGQVAAGAPAEPSKLQRATPLEVLGNTFIIYL